MVTPSKQQREEKKKKKQVTQDRKNMCTNMCDYYTTRERKIGRKTTTEEGRKNSVGRQDGKIKKDIRRF